VSGPDLFSGDRRESNAAGRGIFAGLNVDAPSFPRLAAQRIADLEDLADVRAALSNVPPGCYGVVETLALQGIAIRIARLPELEQRRAELRKIPEDLRGRVEPLLRSYYQTKPWLYRGGRRSGQ
jgi:hypothetical protein